MTDLLVRALSQTPVLLIASAIVLGAGYFGFALRGWQARLSTIEECIVKDDNALKDREATLQKLSEAVLRLDLIIERHEGEISRLRNKVDSILEEKRPL
jgi:hypothetical protein